MKIQFPIDNDRDYETVLSILDPELFAIEYASVEAREFYYSLTEQEKEEIKSYVKNFQGSQALFFIRCSTSKYQKKKLLTFHTHSGILLSLRGQEQGLETVRVRKVATLGSTPTLSTLSTLNKQNC